MTEQQKKMIGKLGIALVICIAASLYICGIFEGIQSLQPTLNPATMLARFVTDGFPLSSFLWTFFLTFIISVLLMARSYSNLSTYDKMGRLFKMTKGTKTYGEAHFEDPEEYKTVAVVQREEDSVGTILGQLDESGKYPIVFREDKENRLNRHIAIVGASGSGKTYTFSKNYVFQAVKRRESVILTDPDGGLFADMAGYFEDRGYIVRRFDLANLDKSDGWNCMKILTNDLDRIEENAEIFSEIIISNISGPASKSMPIFKDGPKSLLKALLLRVALGHDFKPEEKNIGSVYQLLQNPLGEEFLDSMFDADTLTPEEKPCLGPYLSFKQASPNLRGNLMVNLAANLNVLQTKKVRTVLSTDCIDLSLPGKQPCAYFCIFPDSHSTYKFIVSLFFSMLFVTLTNDADARRSRKLDTPVDFLLDEFPSIGVIPDFAKKMATIRKRMMNVCMIFQDITQLRQNYLDSWTTVLGNCATFIDLGINDADSADLVTKRIGDTTVQVETVKHNPMEIIFNNQNIFHQRNTGEGKRALVSFSELFSGMKENDSIIMFQYHNPILAKKYPYVLHSEAKYLRPIYPDEIPSIDDEEGRAAYYAEQERIYKDFMAKHPHINEIDRTYQGRCESVAVKSVWEEGSDAIKAFAKEVKNKPKKDLPVQDVVEVSCQEVDCQIGSESDASFETVEAVEATPVIVQAQIEQATESSDGPDEELFPDDDNDTGRQEVAKPDSTVPGEDSVPQAVREAQERAAAKAMADAAHKKKHGGDSVKSPEEEAFESEAGLHFNPTTIPSKRGETKPFTSCASAPPQKRKKP